MNCCRVVLMEWLVELSGGLDRFWELVLMNGLQLRLEGRKCRSCHHDGQALKRLWVNWVALESTF
jgi:hypothetical protein